MGELYVMWIIYLNKAVFKVKEEERKQKWQNINNWWIQRKGIEVLIPSLFPYFCRFENFQNEMGKTMLTKCGLGKLELTSSNKGLIFHSWVDSLMGRLGYIQNQ